MMMLISFIVGVFVGWGAYIAVRHAIDIIEQGKKDAYQSGYVNGSIETRHKIQGGM